MTVDSILELAGKILDVLLVWALLYYALKSLRKNVKMVLLFKGILIILIIKVISYFLDLVTIGYIIDYIIEWAPFALIVIFQPEIRTMLESIGRTQLLGRHKVLTVDEREKVVYEIMQAVEYMKRNRIGALLVIERDYALSQYIEPANKIYADLSSELLISIFFPNNPLHDGAVIVQGDRITCAGSVLPTSMNTNISKRLGTRHRAALGISEETDCISLIASEETGRLSIALGGELHYNLTLDEVKLMLLDELRPKKATVTEEEEETIDEEFNTDNE